MDKRSVLTSIKDTLKSVLPPGGHACLYGSQARGDARPDSDWDVLILLDKPTIEKTDYDNVSYPLVELGWTVNECISPVIYTWNDWQRCHFTPFFHHIKEEGIRLV